MLRFLAMCLGDLMVLLLLLLLLFVSCLCFWCFLFCFVFVLFLFCFVLGLFFVVVVVVLFVFFVMVVLLPVRFAGFFLCFLLNLNTSLFLTKKGVRSGSKIIGTLFAEHVSVFYCKKALYYFNTRKGRQSESRQADISQKF